LVTGEPGAACGSAAGVFAQANAAGMADLDDAALLPLLRQAGR
jgi:hypothetical protein